MRSASDEQGAGTGGTADDGDGPEQLSPRQAGCLGQDGQVRHVGSSPRWESVEAERGGSDRPAGDAEVSPA